MAANKEFKIAIVVDTAGKGFKELGQEAAAFRTVMTGTVSEFQGMNRAVNFVALQQGFQALGSVVSQLQTAFRGLTDAYAEQVRVEEQLATSMSNTMNATQEDIQAIKDLCSAQQQLGVVGDEVQLSGAARLATFLTEREALESLIPVMNDMIVSQYGLKANGESAASVAMLLGKAMTGQETALRRYGYTFTEAQRAILSTGTEMERVAVVAEVVGRRVGGSNEAMAQSAVGSFVQMQNALGDLKEQMGGLVQGVMPAITMLSSLTVILSNGGRLFSGIGAITTAMRAFTASVIANSRAVSVNGITSLKNFGRILRINTLRLIAGKSAIGTLGGSLTSLAGTIGALAGPIAIAVGAIALLWHEMDNLNKQIEHNARLRNEARAEVNRRVTLGAEVNRSGETASANIRQDYEEARRVKDLPQPEQARFVARMNERYGADMGHFDTVEDWTRALWENRVPYIRKAESRARMANWERRIQELQTANADIDAGTYSTDKPRRADRTSWNRLSELERKQEEKHRNEAEIRRLERNRQREQGIIDQSYSVLGYGAPGAPEPAVEAPAAIEIPSAAVAAPELEQAGRTLNMGATTLAELLENAAYYRDRKNNASTPEEYAAAQRGEDFWNAEADIIRGNAAAAPRFNAEATTLDQIENNISVLRESLGAATVDTAAEINEQLTYWQELADAIRNAGEQMQFDDRADTLAGIANNIAILQAQLQNATIDEAAAINESIEQWEEKARAIREAGNEGVAAMKNDGATVTDYTGQLSKALSAVAGATEGSAQAWLNYAGTLLGSLGDMIQGILALGLAKSAETSQSVPFPLNIVALAASMAAFTAAALKIPRFADGGIVGGPTLALVGEYPGASGNPEVIAPLDRLRSIVGGAASGVVEFRIRDRELYGIMHRYNQLNSHT